MLILLRHWLYFQFKVTRIKKKQAISICKNDIYIYLCILIDNGFPYVS
jgi:hypothetical protein